MHTKRIEMGDRRCEFSSVRLGNNPIHNYCFANCAMNDEFGSNDATMVNAVCNADVITHNVRLEDIMEIDVLLPKLDEFNQNYTMIKTYNNPVVLALTKTIIYADIIYKTRTT